MSSLQIRKVAGMVHMKPGQMEIGVGIGKGGFGMHQLQQHKCHKVCRSDQKRLYAACA